MCYTCVISKISLTVYDVTRRESFKNLEDLWAKEVELYSTNPECIKILVGNKVDKVNFVSNEHCKKIKMIMQFFCPI